MPDINSAVKFDDAQERLIQKKLSSKKFSSSNWGDKDLLTIRSYIRKFYRNEQKGRCAYCKNVVSLQSVNNCHIEHIVPKSLYRHFIFEAKNLCVICADCNDIKRNQETLGETINPLLKPNGRKRYPLASKSFKIVHPHFDNYFDHIQILAGYFYVDKSKKGNFTIGACRLNRRLYEYGWQKEIVDDDRLSTLMTEYLKTKAFIKRKALLDEISSLLVVI